jgi:hypothetical protein
MSLLVAVSAHSTTICGKSASTRYGRPCRATAHRIGAVNARRVKFLWTSAQAGAYLFLESEIWN